MHSASILLVLSRVSQGVGNDFCHALAGQVDTALLEPGENFRVNEGIPTGTTLGEAGILGCQRFPHGPEPVQEERVLRAKAVFELLAQADSQSWGTTTGGDGNGQGPLAHYGPGCEVTMRHIIHHVEQRTFRLCFVVDRGTHGRGAVSHYDQMGPLEVSTLIGARYPGNSASLSPEAKLSTQVRTDNGHGSIALQQPCHFALGLTSTTNDNTALCI